MSSQFSPPLRVQVLLVSLLLLLVTGAVLTDPLHHERARLTAATTTTTTASHALRRMSSDAELGLGTSEGTRTYAGSLTISRPIGTSGFTGGPWSYARWTSWWVQPGAFTQLIPTWDAVTPAGTFVQVQARVRSASGAVSGWKVMGSWATRDSGFRRTSAGEQRDSVASVATDTLVAAPGVTLSHYQLRAVLLRQAGTSVTPTVGSLQAVASRPATTLAPTSQRLLGGRELAVPRYSQMIHRGQYPQWGGGGQAWCSPTSLSMVLGYYRSLPSPSSYAWVSSSYADRWVDHVARLVYDYGYQGAGNWAFNTAYAAALTDDAFVTRLGSLREAERFIAAGIPLVASISFSSGQLSGAPISATNGHLVVIRGFTSSGDVIVNDPAAYSDATVRRVYDRGQFERAWQGRSHGTVYVVHDAAHPLPDRGTNRNW